MKNIEVQELNPDNGGFETVFKGSFIRLVDPISGEKYNIRVSEQGLNIMSIERSMLIQPNSGNSITLSRGTW